MRASKRTLFLSYIERGVAPRDELFPQVGGLLSDDSGYIWVKAFDPYTDSIWLKENALWPAQGGEWRVIRPDGKFVAVVAMPHAVRPLEIKENRLLGVSTDALGVQRIVIHRIQR